MVPNGWKEIKLIDTSAEEKHSFTGGPFGSNLKSSDYTETGIRIIQLQNIGDGKFLNDYKIFTSEEKADELISCNIYPGDIILSKMGDPVARATIIPDYHDRYLMASDGIRLKVNEEKFDTFFIHEVINAPHFRRMALAKSTGSTRRRIGLTDLRNITFYCPPLPEQQKIAKILTTWDKAIDTTERLIDNSKQQKKALMQQLLTGKKRLLDDNGKRFEGEWDEYTLEQAATYRRGSFPQPYGDPRWVDEVNGYPFVQVYDIDKNMKLKSETKIKISDAAIDKSVFIPKDTIVVSLQGSIGRVAITQYDAYVDRTILLFQEFLKPMNKVFFAYIIQELFDIEKTKAPGGTIKTITKAVLSNFRILTPSLEEQQKIAAVLTNADKEIELLEQQLADLQQEKKALMQQLLTGKVRVAVA